MEGKPQRTAPTRLPALNRKHLPIHRHRGLLGSLVIDKTGLFVKSLELTNTEPFSPAIGVKINKMRVQMKFALDQQGRFALRELRQSVDGRLFGIKRLTQASTITYSEFTGPNERLIGGQFSGGTL